MTGLLLTPPRGCLPTNPMAPVVGIDSGMKTFFDPQRCRSGTETGAWVGEPLFSEGLARKIAGLIREMEPAIEAREECIFLSEKFSLYASCRIRSNGN